MSESDVASTPWTGLREAVAAGEVQGLVAYLDTLTPSEVARALTRLDIHERHDLLVLLKPDAAADLIEELADAHAADIMEALGAHEAAAIADELESDHRADILGEMAEQDAERILQAMDPEEAEDARSLLQYPDDTAGGIMVTEFVSYPQDTPVAHVLRDMRENAERYSDYGIHYAYVESERGGLVGVVPMRVLLLATEGKRLADVMMPNPIYAPAAMELAELDQLFERYPFWNLPVTDAAGRMLGVIRRADLEEALGEEQEKTLLRFGGIIGGEEIRSMPLIERTTRRMVWLGLNVMLSLIAASVILLFEGTVDRVFALVFFIPVIGNMCGCSGNQAVAVSIRELTLGLVQSGDYLRVWRKEMAAGAINGTVIGIILGLFAMLLDYFLWHDSPWIGVIVAFAFLVNTMVSVSVGGLIPLLLRRFKADPALGAPPIMTTLTDMCGFVLILTLTALALKMGIM